MCFSSENTNVYLGVFVGFGLTCISVCGNHSDLLGQLVFHNVVAYHKFDIWYTKDMKNNTGD